MRKKLFSSLLLVYALSVMANNESIELDVTTNSKVRSKISKRDWRDSITFSYGLQYLGPSLGHSYQNGATYNRFNTGQDFKNDDLDPTGSYQIYQSFALGYKLSKAWKLTWSYTFQENLRDNIRYKVFNKDGSIFAVNKRVSGVSYNNQRINFFSNNLFSNNYFFVMSNFFYEMPTTDISRDNDMLYGLGLQPMIGIYSRIPYIYHGIKASIQRDYYRRQEFSYHCGNMTCLTKQQTLRTNITAYIGYNVTDKLLFQSDFIFDWDKDGNEAEWSQLHHFNRNMDDVLEFGPRYYPGNNMSFGAALQYSLNKLSSDASALLFNFGVYL